MSPEFEWVELEPGWWERFSPLAYVIEHETEGWYYSTAQVSGFAPTCEEAKEKCK